MDIHKDNREKEVVDLAIERMQTPIQAEEKPSILLQAGEAMGRLGFEIEQDDFVFIKSGTYDLEELGKKKIKAFEISRFPVTNFWYEQFITAGGYGEKKFWTGKGLKWMEQNQVTEPLYWRERRYNCPTSPVVGISWYEAVAFCRWFETSYDKGFSYRLPTEEEWQAVAAGKEKRRFPWGDRIDPQKCNYDETGLNRPSPVGIFLEGNTPEGVHDLAGNVWEWTSSYYDKNKNFYALRGGSFRLGRFGCRCADHHGRRPDERDSNVGFRCARIRL